MSRLPLTVCLFIVHVSAFAGRQLLSADTHLEYALISLYDGSHWSESQAQNALTSWGNKVQTEVSKFEVITNKVLSATEINDQICNRLVKQCNYWSLCDEATSSMDNCIRSHWLFKGCAQKYPKVVRIYIRPPTSVCSGFTTRSGNAIHDCVANGEPTHPGCNFWIANSARDDVVMHEFAHLLGAHHEYFNGKERDAFSVMSYNSNKGRALSVAQGYFLGFYGARYFWPESYNTCWDKCSTYGSSATMSTEGNKMDTIVISDFPYDSTQNTHVFFQYKTNTEIDVGTPVAQEVLVIRCEGRAAESHVMARLHFKGGSTCVASSTEPNGACSQVDGKPTYTWSNSNTNGYFQVKLHSVDNNRAMTGMKWGPGYM